MLHEEISRTVIGCFYKVYNALGYGFLEKVYERSLIIELRSKGLKTKGQVPLKVFYEGVEVGYYQADIVVEEVIILELKSADAICIEHTAQLINYLKATGIEVGLLLNFGPRPEFKRLVFETKKYK